MASKNRTCLACSTKYSYCPNCGGADRLKPTWYAEFCSEDCKELWLTATKFNMGLLTKQEAQEAIITLNTKEPAEYVECVQHDLETIFAADEEPKHKRGKKSEPEVIDPVLHAVVVTTIEENV